MDETLQKIEKKYFELGQAIAELKQERINDFKRRKFIPLPMGQMICTDTKEFKKQYAKIAQSKSITAEISEN